MPLCGEALELAPDVPVRGVADALVLEDVLLRAALELGEAFGEALTVADAEADALVYGVIDAAGLALIEGEPLIPGEAEAVAFVEAALPVL